jgi:serine/threonine protein kinase
MKTVVLKTIVGCGRMSGRCSGQGCNGFPCFAHREMRALQNIANTGGSVAVCLPLLSHAFHFGGCLLFQRLPYDLLDFITQRICPIDHLMMSDLIRRLYLGLSHLHSVGVVHGDIKPDNIVVRLQEERLISVKLIDFDQAVIVTEIPTFINADERELWKAVCVEHTPRYVDPYPILFQLHTPMTDGIELTRVLMERDLWGLAMTLGVVYVGNFLPAEPSIPNIPGRTLEQLVMIEPSLDMALSVTDQAITYMKAFFDKFVISLEDHALTSTVRDLVFGVLETRVFDESDDKSSRRPFFEIATNKPINKKKRKANV